MDKTRTRWAPGAQVLADAARAVEQVAFDGRSADAALSAGEGAGRAAVQAITLGTLRWYLRLKPAVESLLPRPQSLDPLLRSLLSVAAHQVEYSRNAPELSVHAAVDAARVLQQPRAAGLVNAVLRRFVAGRPGVFARVDTSLAGRTAHPAWLVRELARDWPERVPAILEGNNLHPPMALRVDLSRTTAPDFTAELEDVEIGSHMIQWMPSGVILDRPMGVNELPGFAQGRVSVQDLGAQLAAWLLDVRAGQRVLDACAAPGGKTGHILERAAVAVTAVDVDAGRTALVEATLARLGRSARVCVGDLREPVAALAGEQFERILVDAPCSSTGVIRRHPDIKLLRRESDVAAFAATQFAILKAVAPLLAPGGRLLYCTCSVLSRENEAVVSRLLAEIPELAVAPIPPGVALPPGAVARPVGIQLLPGTQAGTDGFYYACVEKATNGA
ncbi:MAG: 16S rRNA (cytosine(967)-C(5))-methyltransferase RsmB [Proteobacteria bacterium]|nr:16S rRNA (cytosine(967)-C(5))-methyltransferase RsmB [Pseudomonadota bacterium]